MKRLTEKVPPYWEDKERPIESLKERIEARISQLQERRRELYQIRDNAPHNQDDDSFRYASRELEKVGAVIGHLKLIIVESEK